LPAVREDESPWTKSELTAVRKQLEAELAEKKQLVRDAEAAFESLIRDSGEGAGDDQADAGTKTFEREHEMSLAYNAQMVMEQTERALQRLASGAYGVCEDCTSPIGKYRLQYMPRATLCRACKEREDRH
jgi:DnaK suppressor protein